ncbi:hypothetical protein DB347_25155 [Opitutaceae bacterium EW11]|nr:hypothetical protein DB347_25155 [Opitutaceae bacterium EW11]
MMSNVAEEVRAQFTGFEFGPPCAEVEVTRAEHALGQQLPLAIRSLYLAFDGFRGPTNARFMWPLFGRDGLVEFNGFLRSGSEFPRAFVSSCVFYGDAGIGEVWGIKHELPGRVIRWNASWGEDFEDAGSAPLEVWLKEKAAYDELARKTK